jgi:Flp pilus assembly protein TadD
LLDVGLGRPRDALVWLERAHRTESRDVEIAASYAHALTRIGRGDDARRILGKAPEMTPEQVEAILSRWAAESRPHSQIDT